MAIKEEIEKRLQHVETKRLVVGIVLDVVREKMDEKIKHYSTYDDNLFSIGYVRGLKELKEELEK